MTYGPILSKYNGRKGIDCKELLKGSELDRVVL